SDTTLDDRDCPRCGLHLDGRRARDLHRVRVAQREVRTLFDRALLDPAAAEEVLKQLEARASSLRGLPASRPGGVPRAKPVAPPASLAPVPAAAAVMAPADAVEV